MIKNHIKDNPVEALAIVGIGCRFPGGIRCPQSFWKLVCEGRDAITEVPPDRWDVKSLYDQDKAKNGKIYTRKGGFIDNITLFDPQFFGISPREASYMDPQQRLLLEVTWEALEDGGISPKKLAGSMVGVFVGVFMHDFENLHSQHTERDLFGPHSATGMSATISANRISYVFDFKGPSMVIDTACSSSLVAVHLACQSIWNNESELALAGGVNLLINPEMTMVLCKGSFLSPDGYCKSFDAGANGYARSEGVGMVVLKRLSKALEDRDPIYAVIRGSAVNQDGKSEGLTVPSLDSQVRVIQDALHIAGKAPEEVQYVEAHGTGTPVGDPVEARALAAALTRNRPHGECCIIGSVKSNFGHTESTAGVAGLVKAALMLKHGKIPPNLHFNNPNPQIPFEQWKLRVPTSLEPWPTPAENGHRVAGVNSFGFGGTNAHVILESYEAARDKAGADTLSVSSGVEEKKVFLIPLSAHSPKALNAVASSYVDFLNSEGPGQECVLPDLAYTTSLRRAHHDYRLSIAARSKKEFVEHLAAFLEGEKRPGMSSGQIGRNGSPKLAFVFSGMGQQWLHMSRYLYEAEPVFREAIEECDAQFRQYTDDWSLLRELNADEKGSRLGETQIIQPWIFALQAALVALWRTWGIVPDTVVGHSVGEVAAAYAAGILSLEDATRISFHRSRLQQRTAGQGKMLAVGLPLDETERLLAGHSGDVSIAAVNSLNNLTLSGDEKALKEIAGRLEKGNLFARFLNVDVPFHSSAMDSILAEFEESLDGIRPRQGHIPLVSTVTGKSIKGRELTAKYWLGNARQPVLFAEAFGELIHTGHDFFIEISAHPVLATSMRDCLDSPGVKEAVVIGSLRRREEDDVMLYGSLGQLYNAGYPVDWNRLYDNGGRLLSLPSYPWQGEYYWTESEESEQARLGKSVYTGKALVGRQVHPLLGGRLNAAAPTWNVSIDSGHPAYLGDHVVQGSVVYPGAAYLEMANAAAKELFGEAPYLVRNVEIKAPILLQENEATTVQLTVENDYTFSIYSKTADGEQEWNLHATGKLERIDKDRSVPRFPFMEMKEQGGDEIPRQTCYARFHSQDLEYGPCFQSIEQARINEKGALAHLKLAETVEEELEDYHLHPVVLDACFQVMGLLSSHGTYLPVKVDHFRLYGRPGTALWCYANIVSKSEKRIQGDIRLFDDAGNMLMEIEGFHCRKMEGSQEFDQETIDGILYEYEWVLDDSSAQAERSRGIDYLPAPGCITEKLQPGVSALVDRHERRAFHAVVEPKIDALCTLYIVGALKELGCTFRSAESFTTESLAGKLGIVQKHHELTGRLLEILEEDGILKKDGRQWKTVCQPPEDDPQAVWRELLLQHPAYLAELSLVQQCGSQLKEVLRDEKDPQSIIFSKDSPFIGHFYHDSPTFRIYNSLMQQVFNYIAEHLPERQTLRILEIGAGTGSMTSCVLPTLPPNRTHYVFTDISQAFTVKAEQRFRDIDFMEYRILDIEREPISQGFDPGSFDLILAADVLHATVDMNSTLSNVKSLLAPGGLLLLLEITNSTRWFDIVFGMLDGWWRFSDHDIRPSHATLPKGDWIKLLESTGFSEVVGIPGQEGEYEPLHSVLISRRDFVSESLNPSVDPETDGTAETPEAQQEGQWLILADDLGVADRLAGLLKARNITPFLITRGDAFEIMDAENIKIRPDQPGDFSQMFGALCPDNAAAPVVIDLWGVESRQEEITSTSLERTTNSECIQTLYLVQALMDRDWASPPSLWLVTNGTQRIGDAGDISLVHTPLWGLGRVMVTELGKLRTRMVDLSPAPSEQEIRLLSEKILSPDSEDETALRGERRYKHRLTTKKEIDFYKPPDRPYHLNAILSMGLKGLSFRETARRKPGPGEVEIQVFAAGLNFKDVAIVTGLLDDVSMIDQRLQDSLGWECSGVIVDVGEGVERFSPGDEVMGLVFKCFANYITIDSISLVHKPSYMSFEEAATIPLAFLTSYYSLHKLAGIQKGDRVLIHSASGGVGLSALQVARAAGAEIFATAGTPEKRDFLRAMGIRYVGDSRSMEFAEEILDITGQEGIDIVLNTLSAKTFAKSMSLLKTSGGRFVDLGNVYERSVVLYSLGKGVSFHSVVFEKIVLNYPDLLSSLWKKVMECFNSGKFHAFPYRVFSVSEIADAFQYMREGRHIGKIVVSMQDPGVVPVPNRNRINVHKDGTYLIPGGLGGFGLAVARWLVSCGARHLVLIGRSGASSPEARETIESLKKYGAEVLVERVDVTREDQVKGVLEKIDKTMPSLRGIIHAAMVLDDAPLLRMTASQMKKVLDPKILGAWNLHTQTVNKNLDFFICLSSIASIIGNAEQGNYSAANLFLDSLAHYRRAHGLPALTVNWGAIEGAGYVDERDELKKHIMRQGISMITLNQAWMFFSYALEKNLAQIGAVPVNWRTLSKYSMSVAKSPRFSQQLKRETGREDESSEKSVDLSLSVSPEERKVLITELVSKEVAKVLGIPGKKLDTEKAMDSLGVDSLMAVELVVGIETVTGIALPKMVLLRPGLTVAGLVDIVEKEIQKDQAGMPVSAEKKPEDSGDKADLDTLSRDGVQTDIDVDKLDDKEVESILSSLLSEPRQKDE